jgi:hypothetical protein
MNIAYKNLNYKYLLHAIIDASFGTPKSCGLVEAYYIKKLII